VRIACVLLVFFASLASAQTTDPKLSDAAHAKIRDLQLQQKDVQVQYLQMQQQLASLEKQFNGRALPLRHLQVRMGLAKDNGRMGALLARRSSARSDSRASAGHDDRAWRATEKKCKRINTN
jgi:hypothetical protein